MAPGGRVLVVGSINMDLVFRADRVPEEGETLFGTEFRQVPGGKGANQAVAAARLGAAVTMIGRVGEDSLGAALTANLSRAGVETEHIARDPAAPSGVAAILLDGTGNNRIIVFRGANGRLGPGDIERAWPGLGPVSVLVLQLEIPLAAVAKAAELAAASGIPVILNPAPAQPLPPRLLALTTVLTPNETEASCLTGVAVTDDRSAAAAASRLRDQGCRAVIVTRGKQGLLVLEADGAELIPPFRVQAVDTVGAGDAFTGALAAEMAAGRTLREAARYANVVAALAVTKPGAQDSMPTREEVEVFLHIQKEGRKKPAR